jgi:hypothetical protein
MTIGRPLYQMDDPGGPDHGSPFPEWIHDPNDRTRWRELNVAGGWFVYNIGRYIYAKDGYGPSPLYIGSTGNLERRLRDHQRNKWWWPGVDVIMVGLADSEDDARAWERRYIGIARPIFNIVGVNS